MLQQSANTVDNSHPAAAADGEDEQLIVRAGYCRKVQVHIQLIAALCMASYAGVAARVYLSKLGQIDGVAYFHSLYAQLVGTTIMGLFVAHKEILEKKHQIIFSAITVGLCGSMTTFSSWNEEAALSLLQVNTTSVKPFDYPDNQGRAAIFFTILLLGLSAPIGALKLGINLANTPVFSMC